MGVVRSNNTNNGTSNGPDENQKVFVNLGNDKPQVRQVTNVKFAASVVNGNVHMNNYGKMQVLPDKPVIIPQQTEKVYEGKPISGKKASDDSEVVTQKSELHGVNAAEVKGILKRPGGMRTLKKAGSTGTVHPAGFDVKDSIEIAKANIQTHHEPKQVPKKKSVRFADLRYSDDMEEEEPESMHTNRAAQKHHRPVSAKVSSQTKIETRIPRVSSAGSQRAPTQPKPHKSSLVRPQAAAHIIAHTSAATAILMPSALSIEEQRLLESLDRLNEKLKITEFPGALLQEANQMPPEPVPQTFIYSGAFKGHQPINSQRRVLEASRGGGFRATSANRNQNFRYS
ncbi:hypothetical protein FSP39_005820 [Pinctada imbricata]|uniref:Uncharacterized protein n=1 Tax=Pinctada imbricata TaxID=66713 RepID=A0AA88YD42_PINIB|nr:hypothetical protein FSP39_005820 [Pinctada imbricata]